MSLLCLPSTAWAQFDARMLADTSTTPTRSPLLGSRLVPFAGQLYFVGSRPWGTGNALELWRTDGMRAEHVRHVVAPFALGDWSAQLIATGDNLLIPLTVQGPVIEEYPTPHPLWVSDGTTAGTFRYFDYESLPATGFETAGEPALFAHREEAIGEELWVTDGTAAGTRLLADLEPGADSSDPHAFVSTPHGVFFLARGRLYRSDGTSAIELAPSSATSLAYLGDLAGRSILGSSDRLWSSDGTVIGTTALADLSVLSGAQVGDSIVFIAEGDPLPALYAYDLLGLREIVGPTPRFNSGVVVSGERGFFFSEGELWRTDGTDVGTSSIATFTSANTLTAFASGVAFLDFYGISYSDGTSVSRLFDDSAHDLTAFEDQLYFFSENRLIRSDGVSTTIIEDFNTQQTDDNISRGGAFVGGRMLLMPQVRLLSPPFGRHLWESDGSPEGTEIFTTLPPIEDGFYSQLIQHGPDGVFLERDNASLQWRVWRTDGTGPGTTPIATGDSAIDGRASLMSDGFRSFVSGSSTWILQGTATLSILDEPSVHVFGDAVRSFLLTVADDNRLRLYETDGTLAGTGFVDALDYPQSAFLVSTAVADDRALLLTDGALYEVGGRVGAAALIADDAVPPIAVADDRAYFFRIAGPIFELWIIDPGAPPAKVADLPGPPLGPAIALEDRLLFAASSPDEGAELWISDGTPSGTHLVVDLVPGRRGSDPINLTAIGDRAVFFAADDEHGRELWMTDGTAAGTVLLDDAVPGPDGVASQFPAEIRVAGDHLYFTGYTVDQGHEPWAISVLAVTCGNGVVDDFETCDSTPCCNSTCALEPAGSSCGDSFCGGAAMCDPTGACIDSPLEIDDGDPCTFDACDEAGRQVTHASIEGCEPLSTPPLLEEEGCACSATEKGPSALLALALLALFLLRRKR